MSRLLNLLLFSVLLTSAGCGDFTGPDLSHVGTYPLATINGRHLPGIVFDIGGNRTEIAEGFVSLESDGSFVNELVFRITDSGEVRIETERVIGTFTRAGNSIEVVTDDLFALQLRFENGELTQTIERLVLKYRR